MLLATNSLMSSNLPRRFQNLFLDLMGSSVRFKASGVRIVKLDLNLKILKPPGTRTFNIIIQQKGLFDSGFSRMDGSFQ